MRSLHVEDSGPGLTDVQLSLLFQPFERLGAQRTPAPGVGLGLAVSQQLAQLINGPIEVRSEPGVGSCFTLGSRRPGLTGRAMRCGAGRRAVIPTRGPDRW